MGYPSTRALPCGTLTALTDLPPSCAALNGEQVMRALRSPEAMRDLLEHLAHLAAPRSGATKILVPLCQMGSKRCKWVDSALTIEIVDEGGERTKILAGVDIGGGARELLFPKLILEVPWTEFAAAIEAAPRLVEPMTIRVKKRSILLAAEAETVASVAPPSFAIAEDSWRRSLPPAVRRSLTPKALPMEVDVPAIGEAALLAHARLAPPKAMTVGDADLRVLRSIAELDDPADDPASARAARGKRASPARPSRAPTKKPPAPPPKKGVVVRKRVEKT